MLLNDRKRFYRSRLREAVCLLVIGVVFGVRLTWISAQAVTHLESQQSSSFVCSFLPPLFPSIHPSLFMSAMKVLNS